ncbi:hypothetical protein SBOR_2119 [Sclerotinia borealis F-4128]|uniref:Uncharacterized protein n=1 Tax=Sclerotinia borealis (strain F-4128) TaxID=1432307 RepID=W9CSH0_SCLBF|nr:hypothetical protein SBOR_2119 [Sclerotinia borealis F-4128]
MSSVQNTQGSSSKSASVDEKNLSSQETTVGNVQATNVDPTSSTDTMVVNMEPITTSHRKRSIAASSSQSSGAEESGSESSGSSKRRKVELGLKASPSRSRPVSPRGPTGYKGIGLTSSRNGLAAKKDGRVEELVGLEQTDTTEVSAAVAREATDESSSDVSSSPSIVPTSSSLAAPEPVEPKYLFLVKEEDLPRYLTVDRLSVYNRRMRSILKIKADDGESSTPNRLVAELLIFKDYVINDCNKRLSDLEDSHEESLEQLYSSNEAAKAELAVFTSLEEQKKDLVNLWRVNDVLYALKFGRDERIADLGKSVDNLVGRLTTSTGLYDCLRTDYEDLVAAQERALKEAAAAAKEETRLLGSQYQELLSKFNSSQEELKSCRQEGRILNDKLRSSEVLVQEGERGNEMWKGKYKESNDLVEEQKITITAKDKKIEDEVRKGSDLQMEFDRLKEVHSHCQNDHELLAHLDVLQDRNDQLAAETDRWQIWFNETVKTAPRAPAEVAAARSDLGTVGRELTRLQGLLTIETQRARHLEGLVGWNSNLAGGSGERPLHANAESRAQSRTRQSPTESLPAAEEELLNNQSTARRNQEAYFNTAFHGMPGNTQMGAESGNESSEDLYGSSPPPHRRVAGNAVTSVNRSISPVIKREEASESPAPQQCPHDWVLGDDCQHCGKKVSFDDLPDYESDEYIVPPRRTGFRPAVPADPVIDCDQSPEPGDVCEHTLVFGDTCGQCGKKLAASAVAGPVSTSFQYPVHEDECAHGFVFNDGTCGHCGKDMADPKPVPAPAPAAMAHPRVSLSSSPSPPPFKVKRLAEDSDSSPPTRGRFVHDSDSDFRPAKEVKSAAKSVDKPSKQSVSPAAPPSEPRPSSLTSPVEDKPSPVNSPGPLDGDADAGSEELVNDSDNDGDVEDAVEDAVYEEEPTVEDEPQESVEEPTAQRTAVNPPKK